MDGTRKAKKVIAQFRHGGMNLIFRSMHDCADYFNEIMMGQVNAEQIRRIINGPGLFTYVDELDGRTVEVFLDYLYEE